MNDKYEVILSGKSIITLVIMVVVVVAGLGALISSIASIDAGHAGVVFNKQTRTIEPVALKSGWSFVWPYIIQVTEMETRVQKEQVTASAASKDLQDATTEVALNYYVLADDAPYVFEHIGLDYKARIIDPAIQESVKASTALFTAEELITKRETVRAKIHELLTEKLLQSRIRVDAVSITNFKFSPDFQKAIEDKQTAAQLALKAENDLKRIQVEAEQRVTQAKGEAEAIRIQAEAITQQGGMAYVALKQIEKWNGVYPQYYFTSTSGGQSPGVLINVPTPAK